MPLCYICKSIPFDHLPPFPEGEYVRTLTGLEHVQTLVRRRHVSPDPAAPSVRHHASLEGLRRAAAEGCELCRLIQCEAEAMLAELDGLQGLTNRCSYGPPTFDMWLTKRPEGGQGFWVLSDCASGAWGPATVPVAAFGFVVAEGACEPWPLLAVMSGR